jgi:hypothetical protein
VCAASGIDAAARRTTNKTGLRALTASEFGWETIWYYIRNTEIPINFGITVGVSVLRSARELHLCGLIDFLAVLDAQRLWVS